MNPKAPEPAGQEKAVGPAPTGAELVVQALRAQGVETVFGIIGAAIMPVYDALYRDRTIRHLTVGHEQGGIHMAEGMAKATGRTGVVMATSGPGATNLTTGLANAMMDSTPLVALTGQVATGLIGRDAFQETDIRGVAAPLTKHTYRPAGPEEIPGIMAGAFRLAESGRPGPVLVDLPKDVCQARALAQPELGPGPGTLRPPFEPHPLQVRRALGLLAKASRPVLLVGGGVISAGASGRLLDLAEALDLPVVSTLMGLGGFPGRRRLFLGLAGMHGLGPANLALLRADLILCLGCRLSDRLTGRADNFVAGTKLIQVDIDPSEIGKNLPASVPMVGHLEPTLAALLAGVQGWEQRPDLTAWHRRIAGWRRRFPQTYRSRSGLIAPQAVIQELAGLLGPEAVVTTGVGQHQMWTAQYYPFERPRTFITSGGLGTMGFGLPAAIGAQVGRPESRVVCLDGDGSFLMTIQELNTAVRYRLPVVAVIIRNSTLGMVRQWQRLFLGGRLAATDLEPPPFSQVAQAFGALGRRVRRPDELAPVLRWALEASCQRSLPAVVEVVVDPEECVLPMVPAGQANDSFIPCFKEERDDQ